MADNYMGPTLGAELSVETEDTYCMGYSSLQYFYQKLKSRFLSGATGIAQGIGGDDNWVYDEVNSYYYQYITPQIYEQNVELNPNDIVLLDFNYDNTLEADFAQQLDNFNCLNYCEIVQVPIDEEESEFETKIKLYCVNSIPQQSFGLKFYLIRYANMLLGNTDYYSKNTVNNLLDDKMNNPVYAAQPGQILSYEGGNPVWKSLHSLIGNSYYEGEDYPDAQGHIISAATAYAKVGDRYYYTGQTVPNNVVERGDVFVCTTDGIPADAIWEFSCNLCGPAYSNPATELIDGLMSAEDKKRFDDIIRSLNDLDPDAEITDELLLDALSKTTAAATYSPLTHNHDISNLQDINGIRNKATNALPNSGGNLTGNLFIQNEKGIRFPAGDRTGKEITDLPNFFLASNTNGALNLYYYPASGSSQTYNLIGTDGARKYALKSETDANANNISSINSNLTSIFRYKSESGGSSSGAPAASTQLDTTKNYDIAYWKYGNVVIVRINGTLKNNSTTSETYSSFEIAKSLPANNVSGYTVYGFTSTDGIAGVNSISMGGNATTIQYNNRQYAANGNAFRAMIVYLSK